MIYRVFKFGDVYCFLEAIDFYHIIGFRLDSVTRNLRRKKA